MAFVESTDKLIFTASAAERILPVGRVIAVETDSNDEGKVVCSRAIIMTHNGQSVVKSAKVIAVARFHAEFIRFRSRMPDPTQYRLKDFDPEHETWAISKVNGDVYHTNDDYCSCGSFIDQLKELDYLRLQLGQDYNPVCKHQTWLSERQAIPATAWDGRSFVGWRVAGDEVQTFVSQNGGHNWTRHKNYLLEDWQQVQAKIIGSGFHLFRQPDPASIVSRVS